MIIILLLVNGFLLGVLSMRQTSVNASHRQTAEQLVELFAANVGPNVKIKAAGGISSLEDAEKFIALGASRLGTSRIVKLAKAMEA